MNFTHNFTAGINCSFISPKVEKIEIPFIATVYYQPAEKQTFDYPGCEEEFAIEEVNIDLIEIDRLLASLPESVSHKTIMHIANDMINLFNDLQDFDQLIYEIKQSREDAL